MKDSKAKEQNMIDSPEEKYEEKFLESFLKYSTLIAPLTFNRINGVMSEKNTVKFANTPKSSGKRKKVKTGNNKNDIPC